LTVLFCDLVTSTELATHLDPEAFLAVIDAYHAVCAAIVERFDGHIAQYLGDGILVYLGYPRAHEDDPRRAVLAGLELIGAVQQIPIKGASAGPLQVRVGIHTGLVVIGEMGGAGRQERLAIGEAPNLASRLQSLAAPDTVLLSGATERIVQGWSIGEFVGNMTLAGFPQSVPVHRVVQESGARSRFDVTRRRGLTPLVGREPELALLRKRWAQIRDGVGQAVLLSGEAGIGKSRLVQALRSHLMEAPHFEWEGRCSPYTQHSALYPVVDLLRRILQLRDDDGPEAKRRKLKEAIAVAPSGSASPDAIFLLASLLSIPLGDSYPTPPMHPEQRKQKTFEALLSLLIAVTTRQPVLLVIEDLHWADASTIEFLGLLIDQAPGLRLLTILVFRPDFRPPWDFREHLTQLTVTRLAYSEARTMVVSVAADKALPAEVLEQVVKRTDGVPLFVEELTTMVLESGWLQEKEGGYELTRPLPVLAIPATLSDSLMARLDRLDTAKPVAQLGSVIGRQFSYSLLRAVSSLDEEALRHALGRLVASQMLYQRGVLPQAVYAFKHALIQETAYQSLLKSTRQLYHQRIAEVLVTLFPDVTPEQPELLAHHYEQAGLLREALPYWLQAGQRAVERSANTEAIQHLSKGIEVLQTLPETTEHLRQQLSILVALGAPLFMVKGHASPEVERVYSRALELARRVGDSGQSVAALMGLARFSIASGQLRTARQLREQSLTLAEATGDPILQREARMMLGTTLYYLGELDSARSHLEQGLELEVPGQSQDLLTAFSRGTHPETFSRAHLAWTLWTMGYPERALRSVRDAVDIARRLAHPYSLAHALHFATALHHWRREARATQAHAEETLALSRAQGFDRWVAGCMMMRGWALAEQEKVAEGLAEFLQGLAAWRTRAGALGLPDYLPMLAELYMKTGQLQAALDAVSEGLTLIAQTEERRSEAELYRVKGELLLRSAAQSRTTAIESARIEAEGCFQQAVRIARSQHARSLELRAALSSARLWRDRGKPAEARQLLGEIYAWFTEGFTTQDLREAKSLLGALS